MEKQQRMNKNIFVSVSGGETSWFMAKIIKDHMSDKNLLFGFANTGREREETLEFNKKCSDLFGIKLHWIEAVVHHGKRKGCTHKIVDYETADRSGRVFEDVISKYGIPNVAFPHCTRELKANPLKSFADEYFGKNNYSKAIGIRVDEIDRVSDQKEKFNLIYPLVSPYPTKKDWINSFWETQPFRLKLKSYEGNCDYCFKKSDRKLATVLSHDTEGRFDWWRKMESKYEYYTAKRNTKNFPPPYRFFRKNKTCSDIAGLLADGFTPAQDEKYVLSVDFVDEMDYTNGCEESCEAIF